MPIICGLSINGVYSSKKPISPIFCTGVTDQRDNLLSLTDAEGNVTWFEYDRNNRLTKEIRPMGEETTYTYDAVGNLTQKIDAKGQKTTYEYLANNWLSKIDYYSSSSSTTPEKTVEFSYDDVGNLIAYNDGVTSGTYEYDAMNRKTSETLDFGAFSKTIEYTYYKNGLKKSFTSPDGTTYEYSYDMNNQLAGITIPGVGTITNTEYNWMRPTQTILPGGATKTYGYDDLMRTTSIDVDTQSQSGVMSYAYSYDPMDNILSKNTEHGNYNYGYDDLYRLTNADNPSVSDEGYTYDAVGNRLTATGVSGEWTYNENNELTGYGSTDFTYDANGNMTQKTVSGVSTHYIYNTEDRLSEVRDANNNLVAEYYYDPFGRRLWKDVGGSRTYFMYADEGLVAELNDTGSVTKSYAWKPGGIWGTDCVAVKENGQYYFVHNDHLGTPQKLTDINGTTVWSATYSSFGSASVDPSSTSTCNLRFPGQYYDQESGLHYNWFRYYDSLMGRYLKADPIGFLGGKNLYVYVQNNPMGYIDILGLVKRPLTNSEASTLQNAINMIKNCPNWEHVGNQLQDLLDNNVFQVETDYAGTTTYGDTEHWDYADMNINLNPDILTHRFYTPELIETISHEFVHYSQFKGVPYISNVIYGWTVMLDYATKFLTWDSTNYFPWGFEGGAYKTGEKIREDIIDKKCGASY